MPQYHADAELAPRDIVARAIVHEMERTGSTHVFLDFRGVPEEVVRRRFPNIIAKCREHGIDLLKDLVPVSPAAHYLMGGLRVDLDGRTTVPGLYACGECACTGVHGANRLASNSMLEGLVFGARAARAMSNATVTEQGTGGAGPNPPSEPTQLDPEAHHSCIDAMNALRDLMWRHVGIVRSGRSLQRAAEGLAAVRQSSARIPRTAREGMELDSVLTVAELVLEAAQTRTESRGAHFRTDFPEPRPEWRKHICISRGPNGRRRVHYTES
jgi:L-aspartate oxidase